MIYNRNYNWPKEFLFLYAFLLALTYSPVVSAHVGSSGVIVQKQAGKYQLLISIKPPDVVPGTASVTVFVENGRVSSIGARPIYFRSGDKGAPTHDILTPTGQNRYEGDLWLMDSGSSSIELSIDGPDGKQQVVVPVMAVATALREMPEGTGFGLAAMGLLLVVMLITIIGASNADGIVAPGQAPPAKIGRRRLAGMSVGLVVIVLILAGWRSWWNSTAEDYRNVQLYRPTPIRSSIQVADAQRQLTIQFDTTGFGKDRQKRRPLSYLLPDHGKLMHAFLVRMPGPSSAGLDAFAHLHPNRRDTLTYEATLPALPGGRYLLYADVVYRSGFAETLTDTVDVPALKTAGSLPGAKVASAAKPSDIDDSWLVAEPMGVKAGAENVPHLDNDMVVCGKPGASVKLADGSTMLWMDKQSQVLEVGKLYTLKFAVADAQGKAAPLEPYLGMGGHAVILRSDGTVYIHLHPVGTYSMAAEGSLVGRIADTARTFHYPNAVQFRDSIDTYIAKLKTMPEVEKNKLLAAAIPGMSHQMKTNNMVEFPYAFPRAGHYRIWVQVKRNGQVLTGVFDTQVNEPLL
ncbi:hypothetical protein [Spirosoma radiotolerans]|uniref:Uncharacterized protein n=1 Tax=Spirosoma radiotolerans TaxID=1379870 RepID=A0A0E4A0R8_9BACT|nr:hypothetical protein [Spirosoma radiotolerans]AKD58272.1 hypothetical protein SD10_01355 [Spirosoma radiotolerans]